MNEPDANPELTPSSTPEPFMAPESSEAPVDQSTATGKPLTWLPAGLVSFLASWITQIAAFFAAIVFFAVPVIIGIAAQSVWAGVLTGLPLLVGYIVFVWWLNTKLTIKLLRAFDYQAPSFWKTLLGLWLGSLLGGAVMFVVGALVAFIALAVVTSESESNGGSMLLVQALVVLVALPVQIGAVGWALAKMSRSPMEDARAKKIVLWVGGILALLSAIIIAIVVAVLAVAIPNAIHNRDSAKNQAAIETMRNAETALNSYYTENDSFGKNPQSLIQTMSQAQGDDSGIAWKLDQMDGGETMPGISDADPNKVVIYQVVPGRFGGVLFCTASKAKKSYCTAMLGNAPTERFTLTNGTTAAGAVSAGGIKAGGPDRPAVFDAPSDWKEDFSN